MQHIACSLVWKVKIAPPTSFKPETRGSSTLVSSWNSLTSVLHDLHGCAGRLLKQLRRGGGQLWEVASPGYTSLTSSNGFLRLSGLVERYDVIARWGSIVREFRITRQIIDTMWEASGFQPLSYSTHNPLYSFRCR